MATPSDGVGLGGLFGAESFALGGAEDTDGRGLLRNQDADTEDDEEDELRPPLDIPLFSVEKVLSVLPRSKDASGEARRGSSASSPAAGGSARASLEPTFTSGIFTGDDDGPGTAGRPPRARETREGRRELVAAACTSDAGARPGDPPAARVFHAAAHASEEGTRHHLFLRSERAGDSADPSPSARALPWYEGEQARITSLEFSPCALATEGGPLLLCGTRGGGVYVIPAGAALGDSFEDSGGRVGSDSSGEPAIRVLCTAGAPIRSALWWRKYGAFHDDRDALVAVACAANGEIRFWSSIGKPLCAVFAGGRASSAAAVDGGEAAGQYLIISGDRASRVSKIGGVESSRTTPEAHWTLTLERGDASLPEAAGKRGFSPALVEGRFGTPGAREATGSPATLSVHPGAHRVSGADARVVGATSSTLVARLSAEEKTLALFHPSNDRARIATYRVPPGTIAVRVTRRLIFALHRRRNGRARLSALARANEESGGMDAPGATTSTARTSAGTGTGSESGSEMTELPPASTGKEIVPVALQEVKLSPNAGRPLERALMPFGDRLGEERPWTSYFEGCAIAAQGATFACRPATPSTKTVLRGLMGTAKGAEAEAFARAKRRATGKEAGRRRSLEAAAIGDESSTARGGDARGGDHKAEILLRVLRIDPEMQKPFYAEAVDESARLGDISGAARRAQRAAPSAPIVRLVAACLAAWRAADALDHLDRLARDPAKRLTRTRSRDWADQEQKEEEEEEEEEWLRLCCSAHLELSAWAASTAAAAFGVAGTLAEEHPDASLVWPSGTFSPPLAADAAEALARSAAAAVPGHPSLGNLSAAASASRRAAEAAEGITAFVRAAAEASERGGDAEAQAAIARARRDSVSTLRVTLAAGSAVDAVHRGGETLRRFAGYAAVSSELGGPLAAEDADQEERAARSPAAAARAVIAGAMRGARGKTSGDPSASIAVIPLMSSEETAFLAAAAARAMEKSERAGDCAPPAPSRRLAAEIRVAALLCLGGKGVSRDARRRAREQRDLETALREGLRLGTIHPRWAVAVTTGWNDANAAAVALGNAGDWLAATLVRLRAVAETFPSAAPPEDPLGAETRPSSSDDDAVVSALASTLTEYAMHAATTRARASAIEAVSRAWLLRGLPLDKLETLLFTAADSDRAEALSAALRRRNPSARRNALARGSEGHSPSTGTGIEGPAATAAPTARGDLRFSGSFALRVASLRVASLGAREPRGDLQETQTQTQTQTHTQTHTQTQTETFGWSRLRSSLCADSDTSTRARYAAPGFLSTGSPRDGYAFYAFSCGHAISEPKLKESAAAFGDELRRAGCPMSGELVDAEYAMPRIALACPACASLAARAAYGVGGNAEARARGERRTAPLERNPETDEESNED